MSVDGIKLWLLIWLVFDSEEDYHTGCRSVSHCQHAIQDYVHPDDHTQPTDEMTPEFKPFTVLLNYSTNRLGAQYGRATIHCRFVQKVQRDMY